MFRSELRRALTSKSFFAALGLAFAALLIGGMDYFADIFVRMSDGSVSVGTYIEKFLISFAYGVSSLFSVLFPVLAIVPYATSYRGEIDSGYQKLMILKASRWTYRASKMMAAVCSGFLALFLPSFCWLMICRFLIGTGSVKYPILHGVDFLPQIYEAQPFLYGVIHTLNAGIQGAVFALLGMGLSAVVHNRYLAALLPFCYCLFSAIVLDVNYRALNAMVLVAIDGYVNHAIGYYGVILYDMIFALTGGVLFVGGDIYAGKD